jgi:transcriptional regulator with XRE-family HTH domain
VFRQVGSVIEGGTANPTVATLVAASMAYKVPLRELFPEEEKEP